MAAAISTDWWGGHLAIINLFLNNSKILNFLQVFTRCMENGHRGVYYIKGISYNNYSSNYESLN
jgi:hypothetical protein